MSGATRRALGRLPSDRRGFALVIVLWIFVALFVLGAEFSQGMRQDATAAANFADETESYYLAAAAANLTFYRALLAHQEGALTEQQDEPGLTRPWVEPNGEWQPKELWGKAVAVKVTAEEAKIPINWVDDTVLNHVFANLGMQVEDAQMITDSILDWRDTDDEHRLNGAESEYYGSPAKNAPIDAVEELLRVKGVSLDLFYGDNEAYPIGLRQIFTEFGSGPKLNVMYASSEVLRAFFGLDDEELAQILELRDNPENSTAALLDVLQAKVPDPRLSEMLNSELQPSILSVEVQAPPSEARVKAHLKAVIDIGGELGDSSEGVYVIRWMDQLPPVEISPEELQPEEVR